jgi:hypothetical protein
VRLSL